MVFRPGASSDGELPASCEVSLPEVRNRLLRPREILESVVFPLALISIPLTTAASSDSISCLMADAPHRIMLDLLDAIIGDGIEGDGWLPDADELAARYSSDRESAVRAIEGLTLRGLVETGARAARVLPPDRWQLLDRDVAEAVLVEHPAPSYTLEAVEAYRLLAREAGRLAARQARRGDVRNLAGYLDHMKASDRNGGGMVAPGERLVDAETSFHRSLMLISGNRFLAAMVEPLHLALAEARRRRAPEFDAETIRAHERILHAVREADSEAAFVAIDRYGLQLARWLAR